MAGNARVVIERIGPLTDVLMRSRGADPDLEEFACTTERERMIGAGQTVAIVDHLGGLRPGLTADRATEVVWTLISPEVYSLLVVRRGWSIEEWTRWLATSMRAQLLRGE